MSFQSNTVQLSVLNGFSRSLFSGIDFTRQYLMKQAHLKERISHFWYNSRLSTNRFDGLTRIFVHFLSRTSLINCDLCATPMLMSSCCASVLSHHPHSRMSGRSGCLRSDSTVHEHPSCLWAPRLTSGRTSTFSSSWPSTKSVQWSHKRPVCVLRRCVPCLTWSAQHLLRRIWKRCSMQQY